MKRIYLMILGVSTLTGCHSTAYKEKAEWKRTYEAEQARARTEIQRMDDALRQAKARFVERYGRYQCTQDDVPQTDESKGPGHRFKSIQLGDHVTLKLKLGKATHADGSPYGPTRTASRYQLLWDGKLVAEAESLYSTGNEGSSGNRIFYCPKDHTVVVYDDLCWSTQRFCVFEKSNVPGTPVSWRVQYFNVPEQPTAQPLPDLAKILGVGNGRIYVEYDGQPYALPFDEFLVTKLEFTVG
jgi:hypothetical protein